MATVNRVMSSSDMLRVLKDGGVIPDVPVSEVELHIGLELTPEIKIKYHPRMPSEDVNGKARK